MHSRTRLSHTCVDNLGGPLEVVEPGEPVGKHGSSAASLLIASHAVNIRQPLRMHLRRQRIKYLCHLTGVIALIHPYIHKLKFQVPVGV